MPDIPKPRKSQDNHLPPLNRGKAKRLPDGTLIRLNESITVQDPITGRTESLDIENPEPAVCCNPWGLHQYKHGYIGYDIAVTEYGSVLCYECWELNERHKARNRWLGWIYRWHIY